MIRAVVKAALALPVAGALLLSAAPVAAEEPKTGFTPEARAALRAEIRAYLMEHPEVILDVLKELEARRRAAAAADDAQLVAGLRAEIGDDGYSFVAGDPEGDVTVVEFIDYACGFCKRAHEDVKALVRMDGDIRYVIKEFPILGESSMLAARAAMAAMMQGADYYEFHDKLMGFRGKLTMKAIEKLAKDTGVDLAQMRADMKDPQIKANLLRTRELARKLRVDGTPTFVIGDEVVRGYVPLKELQAKVRAAREG